MMLRLAVFDLDYTVWHPEMYQLWGPPKLVPIEGQRNLSAKVLKEAQTKTEGHVLVDRDGSPMRVFPGANVALSEINRMRESNGHDIHAAVASRTDEPRWARICMDELKVDSGHTLSDCFGNRVEIAYGNKVGHIQRLHKKTGIPFEEMCFFDNEYSNIRDVSRKLPAVKCIYTPDGMTQQAWDQAKAEFGLS